MKFTMNVIDGQAGLIICASLIFYSLTIDNILNIIVLLILATISIGMLTGNNGILKKARSAKKETNDASTKEQIRIEILGSFNKDGLLDYNIAKSNLQKIGATVTGDGFPITATLNEQEFTIEEDGIVNTANSNEALEKLREYFIGKNYEIWSDKNNNFKNLSPIMDASTSIEFIKGSDEDEIYEIIKYQDGYYKIKYYNNNYSDNVREVEKLTTIYTITGGSRVNLTNIITDNLEDIKPENKPKMKVDGYEEEVDLTDYLTRFGGIYSVALEQENLEKYHEKNATITIIKDGQLLTWINFIISKLT